MSLFKKSSDSGKKYIEGKYGVTVDDCSSVKSRDCLFSIYDKVCEEFNPPFVSKNLKTAIRSLKESLRGNNQSLIVMHPEDYTLIKIGEFSLATGELVPELVFGTSYELSKLFVTNEVKEDNIEV